MSKESNFKYDQQYQEESLKVSSTKISIQVNTITGKDGAYWVCISPSLDVSGHGTTIEEARTSFEHNITVFCEDLQNLKSSEKNDMLINLGWHQKRFATKQYSKAFVDEEGILQNLENAEVSLETVA